MTALSRDVRRWVAEAIGTFLLVLIGPGAAMVNAFVPGSIGHVGVALSFAFVIVAMIHALGHLSGAHLNPAVTIGFWSARHFPSNEVIPYIAAQCVGRSPRPLLFASCSGRRPPPALRYRRFRSRARSLSSGSFHSRSCLSSWPSRRMTASPMAWRRSRWVLRWAFVRSWAVHSRARR
jgi:hypothetical protein